MPLVGMGILAAVAVGFMPKKSPSVGMDSSGYSSSYGGGSSGSDHNSGVVEAVKIAPAVAPASTVVNTGGGSGTPNTGVNYAAWKKNADGTYTDTKGTVSTADDVKYGWQNNNPSAGVTGAVSGVSQQAFDARIAQDRSSNPLYKDVTINLGLPVLTKAPNNGVVGAVEKANTAPVLNTGNVQSKEVVGNDTVGTILDLAALGGRGNTVVSPALSIGGVFIQNIVSALTGSGIVKAPSLGVSGVIA